MKVLLSCGDAAPRFEGTQIHAALAAAGHAVTRFDDRRARDPTQDLPEAVLAARPERVVLVDPRREEPATLDTARALGAVVIAWFAPLPAGADARLHARRRWIAHAADAVAATRDDDARELRDRHGRAARVVPAGYWRPALSGAAFAAVPGRSAIALRGPDDPFEARHVDGVLGLGPAAAFPRGCVTRPLATIGAFEAAVRGAVYLAGARPGAAAPSVFDDAAAAAACGARVRFVPRHCDVRAARDPAPYELMGQEFTSGLARLLALP